jgi:DNA/RNA endonuclease YhcR with UshA esterase domain
MTLNFSNIESVISNRIGALTVTVTAASANGTTVTYTANNNFSTGQSVSITGLSTAAFNLQNVNIASANTTQFTVTSSATGTAVTGASASAVINIDTKELLLQMKAIESATTNLSLGKVVSEGIFQQASLTSIANQINADIADFQDDVQDLYDAINNAGNVTLGSTQTITGQKTMTSPVLTGTPLAPTAAAGTNTTQIATTAFVVSEVSAGISNLIGSSPTLLNTLQELATAINNDPTFFTTVANGLATKAPINSPTFTGTVTFPASTSGANLINIPNSALTNSSMTINGTSISLGGSGSTYPSQTSNSGKFLTTDGSSAAWGTPFYQVIEQDNTPTVSQRLKLNFVGATVTDDLTNNRTTVTINSSGGMSGYALVKQVEAITGIQIL